MLANCVDPDEMANNPIGGSAQKRVNMGTLLSKTIYTLVSECFIFTK